MIIVALLALLTTGILHLLASPPLLWSWLVLVMWIPALLVFGRLRGWRLFFSGWIVGVAATVTVFYWLPETLQSHSNLGFLLAGAALLLVGLICGLYVAVFAYGTANIRVVCGNAWPAGVAIWFTACEFLNPQLFPYQQGSVWMIPMRSVSASLSAASIRFRRSVLQRRTPPMQRARTPR